MEQPAPKNRRWLLILLPIALVLIGAAGFVLLRVSNEALYRSAIEAAEGAPYASAQAALQDAIDALSKRPLGKELSAKLETVLAERTAEEEWLRIEAEERAVSEQIEAAIAAGELERAATLLDDRDPVRAKELRNELAYREAEAMLEVGNIVEAQARFQMIEGYRDAAARAKDLSDQLSYASILARFTGRNYDETIASLKALGTPAAKQEADRLSLLQAQEFSAARIEASNRISAGLWHSAGCSRSGAPWAKGDMRITAPSGNIERVVSGFACAFGLQDGHVIAWNETFGAPDAIAAFTDVTDLSAGLTHALFLHENGSVTGIGANVCGRTNVQRWNHITAVAAGLWHSVGLTKSGHVVACGSNAKKQCDVSDWDGILAVSVGLWHTVGLKADGTVVACGDNTYHQCDVTDWTDIVAIDCGACFTIGVKIDGTVVACGDNSAGQCNVSNWVNVAAIAAGAYHTIGLTYTEQIMTAGLVPGEPAFAAGREAAAVYSDELDAKKGPWMYLNAFGAVTVWLDESEPKPLFRVDLLACSDALPQGSVSTPEASGRYIQMKKESPETLARRAHAVVAFTGDYIGLTSARKGILIRNGIVYYDRLEAPSYALLPNGTIRAYQVGETNAEALKEAGVQNCFSPGRLLVEHGEIKPTEAAKPISAARVAFGYSDPFHYIAIVSLRDPDLLLTLPEAAEAMLRAGARLAFTLADDTAASLVYRGKELSLLSLGGRTFGVKPSTSDMVVFLTDPEVLP